MSDPIDRLMEDHRTIEVVLEAIEIADGKDLPPAFYAEVIEFIANYADAYHHAREEDRLFPAMEKGGVPREGGPIGVMCVEHEIGRKHVASMRTHLAEGDFDELRKEAKWYVALLRNHIQKEDVVLFPMGRQVVAPDAIERMRREFEELDPGGAIRARYVALANSLRERATAAPER
jgi:hemerythrin-like domain-containing protein